VGERAALDDPPRLGVVGVVDDDHVVWWAMLGRNGFQAAAQQLDPAVGHHHAHDSSVDQHGTDRRHGATSGRDAQVNAT
jgi:hypothetical protein